MTCEPMGPDQWRLGFEELEGEFLINVLARMGRHYQEDVARLPPTLRAYWQGPASREGVAGKESELKESQETLADARAELRSERLSMVENWLREYELAEEHDPWRVEISGAERDDFIGILNDRRMLLAADMGVTEEDMDAEPAQILNESRRMGIFEIDRLGYFIMVMLGPQIYRP